jgi:hypothetical protein
MEPHYDWHVHLYAVLLGYLRGYRNCRETTQEPYGSHPLSALTEVWVAKAGTR